MTEGVLLPYLGWFAFFGLAIIYASYKGIQYLRARCSKQPDLSLNEPFVSAKINEEDAEKGQALNVQDSQSTTTQLDAFKPSILSSFLDIEDMINSSIFTAYFYVNTGYALNSTVGHVQLALFSFEILFQLIDFCVCVLWNFKLQPTNKFVSRYYKFKLLQCNFNFIKILFKLFYSFDHLHQNITFYSIVFSLTMVFRSLWMFVIDFMIKLQPNDPSPSKSPSKTQRVKQFLSDKAKYGLLQLAVITPLFYLVNSIVLALEVMNSKIVMFVYCGLWFLAPWIYFASIELSRKCKCHGDEVAAAVIGASQCCINAVLFLIGIVGGVFVQISEFQFYSTISIYGVGGIGVLLYWCRAKRKDSENTGLVTCFCMIYALPLLVAAGYYLVDGAFLGGGGGEYDGTEENENTDYEPKYEPEYIPR